MTANPTIDTTVIRRVGEDWDAIERLQTTITDCIAMIDDCAGVPSQSDSLVQMVRERLGRGLSTFDEKLSPIIAQATP